MTRALSLLFALVTVHACAQPAYESELENFTGTALPVVVLDTHGQRIPDEPKIDAELRLYARGAAGLEELRTAAPDASSRIGIEVRGWTSQEFPKKQYALELRTEQGDDRAISLLGLPAESDWVLAAPFSDKSLLRNHFAYGLSRELGHYAPRTAFVELFRSGAKELIAAQQYRGLYVLTEKIERGPDRVAIEELTPDAVAEPAIAGGYLLEWTFAERVKRDERAFRTKLGVTMVVQYPKPDNLTDGQLAWIRNYVNEAERAIVEGSDAYLRYFDQAALIDFVLLNELLRNHDALRGSTFMHKTRAGPLVMGPVWDFDRALGDVEFEGDWRSEGFHLSDRRWAKQLYDNEHYRSAFIARYRALRADVLSDARLLAAIDSAVGALGDAPVRNFEKWDVLGAYVKANRAPYARTFEEEIAKLRAWLLARAHWLDAHLAEL